MSYGQYSNGDRLQGTRFTRGDAARELATRTRDTPPKRQKQVFDTDEIAHLWAHKAQDSARNAQGNFYFSGDTIYSYGSHFPIARHTVSAHGKHKGQSAVLCTTKTYSNTTAKHIRNVWSSIRSWDGNAWNALEGLRIFDVENPRDYTNSQMESWRTRIKAQAETVVQPRIRKSTVAARFQSLESLVKQANEFAEFFGERARFKMPESIDALQATLGEEIRRADAKAARDAAKRDKENRARAQRLRDESADIIAAWQAGDERTAAGELAYIPRQIGEAYLRITTSNPQDYLTESQRVAEQVTKVETSLGARVPIAHAVRAMRLIRKLRTAGQTYKRNGHSIHLGHYVLDSVDALGTIKAGCHTIMAAEFERFACVLDTWQSDHGQIPAEVV